MFEVLLLLPIHYKCRGSLFDLITYRVFTNTQVRTPQDEGSAVRRCPCLYNTRYSKETNIYVPTRFEPAIPKLATTDLSLKHREKLEEKSFP